MSAAEALAIKVSEDAWHDFFELVESTRTKILNEYLDEKVRHQPWKVVRKERLTRIWKESSERSIVRDNKGLDKIIDTFTTNVARLQVNTELMGHTPLDPEELAEDALGFEVDLENFANFITGEDGRWRISDYGMDKLCEYAVLLSAAPSDEQRLVVIDLMLNVVHQRSDLAALFVEGGSATLSELSSTND